MACMLFRLTTMLFLGWFIGKKGTDLFMDLGVPTWIGMTLCGLSGAAMGAGIWLL